MTNVILDKSKRGWWKRAVFYQIYPKSFQDTTGSGVGDLNGIISRLDYLQKLGVDGIWLSPVCASPQVDNGYDISDYCAIDPMFGTLEDMQMLIREAKDRGISIILDLVLNHTGNNHSWFLTAVEYLQTLPEGAGPDPEVCPYVDYYTFVRADSCPNGYSAVAGTENWFYESKFSYDMPDLNLANENVRSDIRDIMKFWIDKGVSGFRLDAAKEFYSGSIDKNVEVLNWIQTTATELKPDCYLVAEVWENFGTIKQYYESGITSIFNFAFGNSNGKIPQVIRGAGSPTTVQSYATALETSDTGYFEYNPAYIDAPFLSNHDVGRIAGFVNRDPLKMKMAAAMNVLMSGSCFIYYGEEIGMVGSGNDPSKRAPMVWNDARDNGTTNPPPECQLPEEYPLGSLETQRYDDASLYNYYRQVIAIRNALPVISHGRTSAETALNVDCVSAQRKTWGEESCIILMNVDAVAAEVDLSGYADWELVASLSADGNEIAMDGSNLTIPAFGVAILRPAM